MKSLIKALFSTKKVTGETQENYISEAKLYNLLNAGKIIMKEYLQAVGK